MSVTCGFRKELLRIEMNHDDIFEDTWKDEKHEWLDYVKNDVLCTAFCYARYNKRMEKFTGFGIKNSLTLPILGWK